MPIATRGDGVSIPESNQVIISTTVDVLDDAGFNIGFLQQINRTDSRPTNRIRHLDSVDAGRTLEQSPAPEDNSLSVSGFALYNTGVDRRSILNRMVGTASNRFRSLNSQSIPFEMTERWTHPGTRQVGETLYGDCYLTRYTRPVNIGTVMITESADINVSWVE